MPIPVDTLIAPDVQVTHLDEAFPHDPKVGHEDPRDGPVEGAEAGQHLDEGGGCGSQLPRVDDDTPGGDDVRATANGEPPRVVGGHVHGGGDAVEDHVDADLAEGAGRRGKEDGGAGAG